MVAWQNRRDSEISRVYTHNLHLLEKELVEQYNQILYQEELLWFQKSRSNWIIQGDRNTKFFHIFMLVKRRKLIIEVLKNEDEIWVDDPHDLKNLVVTYFKNLFGTTTTNKLDHCCNRVTCTFSFEDNSQLSKSITDEEVKKGMKNIKGSKPLGEMVFRLFFNHKYWDIVGPDVCSFVKNCFLNNFVSEEINRTLIALIPKAANSERVRQLRPISLCNVTYKVITKILVDRIRPFLDEIVRTN